MLFFSFLHFVICGIVKQKNTPFETQYDFRTYNKLKINLTAKRNPLEVHTEALFVVLTLSTRPYPASNSNIKQTMQFCSSLRHGSPNPI